MDNSNKNLTYIGKGLSAFKTKGFSGLNLDRKLYIKCGKCGDFISMHPRRAEVCSCGNIKKDIDAGIFECKTGFNSAEVYKMKSQTSPRFFL